MRGGRHLRAHDALQVVHQHGPVGQPGERVVERQMGELLCRVVQPRCQLPGIGQRRGLVLQEQHVVDDGVGHGEVVEREPQRDEGGGLGDPRRTDEGQALGDRVMKHLAAQHQSRPGRRPEQEEGPRVSQEGVEAARDLGCVHLEQLAERAADDVVVVQPADRRPRLDDEQLTVEHEVEREDHVDLSRVQAPAGLIHPQSLR